MKSIVSVFLFLMPFYIGLAQGLQPGFDKQEYIDLMKVSARFGDSSYYTDIPLPAQYALQYRSPVFGFDNMWDLYASEDEVAVISLVFII